ncbi:MAG: DUF2272 domain-containing protein [Saprospiraceae bacterium]|nr:DUF2272 domain-containing protein [Saprospiraceae bacterium]
MATLLEQLMYNGASRSKQPDRANRPRRFAAEYESGELESEFDLMNQANFAPFAAELVRLAVQERNRWNNGAIKETQASIQPALLDYWKSGLGYSDASARTQVASRSPWSAAFISWVIRKAGAGKFFRYSGAHWRYISAAKKARLSNDWGHAYWLWKMTERKPRLGDLICKSRSSSGLTYDNAHLDASRSAHCDIVTSVAPGRITVVGGNTGPYGDSVAEKTLLLTPDGYFDPVRNPSGPSGVYVGIMSIY